MTARTANFKKLRRSQESGQAMLFLLLALGLFLLAGVGIAVDMADLWMHRQASQNAADAACTAAAMDMVNYANGATNTSGFTPGTAFNCSSNSTAAPCQYAGFNGYTATGLTANTPSTEVAMSFPSSVPGVQLCGGSPPPAVCTQSGFPSTAFVRATVTDRMRTFLVGLVSGRTTMDVGAIASCGAVLANAPIPILVLNPSVNGSLSGNGNINITVVGGPQRSIQVDSSSASAVSIAGNSNTIDLSHGGPSNTGSDFGITGSEPAGNAGNILLGSTGSYVAPTSSISDPFATTPVPGVPGAPVRPSDLTPAQCPSIPCHIFPSTTPNHGCQDASNGCWLYTPGLYTTANAIQTFKQVDLFDPGIYYMQSDLSGAAHTCLRPSTGTGDGSGGTMFYFSGTHTVSMTANAGTYGVCGTTTQVPLSTVRCINSGTGTTTLPANVVTNGGLTGSVLLGPCQAPTVTALCTPNCSNNYGDPLGQNDPLGEQRGMLFFQDRSANLAAAGNQPSWGGGGAFGLAGIMYFHYCNSANGAGLGSNCNAGAYTDQLSLQGGSCSSTFVVGDIVTDKLSLGGTPCIEMDLNPNALYYVLKASLLQ